MRTDRAAALASPVRMGPDGQIATRPPWGTGDPARPWTWLQIDGTGHAVVHLLSTEEAAGWRPMLPMHQYEDDDYEPEIDLGEADETYEVVDGAGNTICVLPVPSYWGEL